MEDLRHLPGVHDHLVQLLRDVEFSCDVEASKGEGNRLVEEGAEVGGRFHGLASSGKGQKLLGQTASPCARVLGFFEKF